MPNHHLTAKERYCIDCLHAYKLSVQEIAHRLSRSPSTIYRELKRNKPPHSHYSYEAAESYSRERKIKPRTQKRKSHAKLYDVVVKSIRKGLSSELISGRLKREYRSPKMQVSHETIYQWIFVDAKRGDDLYLFLVRHHKKRRKQRRSCKRKLFEDRVSIQR